MNRSRPLRDQTELQRLLNMPPDNPTPWPDQTESQLPPNWDE